MSCNIFHLKMYHLPFHNQIRNHIEILLQQTMSKNEKKLKIVSEPECAVQQKLIKYKFITSLYLECWQRLYDIRPYENFILTRQQFETHMDRCFYEDDFEIVLEFLANNCSRLRTIQIFYICLDIKFLKLKEFISYTLNLTELNLTGVNLTVTFVKLLSYKWLECKIKKLKLSGNELSKHHLQYLRCFLIRNEELKHLDVGYCNIREINFSILADGIYKSKSLKALNATNVIQTFLPNHSDKMKLTLGSLFMKNKLVEIHLNNCCLDYSYIEYIAEYLASPVTLVEKLFLSRNNIGPDGVNMIFKAISKSKVLKVLDISTNCIKDSGGRVIGNMLASTMLTHLNISNNHLSSETVNFILKNIKKLLPLEELWISGNSFDNTSGRIIQRIIASHTLKKENFDVNVYERENELVVFDVIQNEKHLIPDQRLVSRKTLGKEKKYLDSLFWNEGYYGKIVGCGNCSLGYYVCKCGRCDKTSLI